MTIENFNYRTSPLFLRNQFDKSSDGVLKIPTIPKAEFEDEDFKNLLLLGFDRAKADDTAMLDRMVHFFLYDYKFERVWKAPEKCIDKLRRYKAMLSPDFSMYREMNPVIQLYNTFRNRWCGAYFAEKGIKVIPTVSWGDENTFDFCFSGIPKGSTVAVSTYMVSEHGYHQDQKEFFLKGYNEMLKRIEPERIICYNTPFPEMQGNIVFVDYELSSWKYQNSDKPFVKTFFGQLIPYKNSDIIYKRGYVIPYAEEKGMGSAYGGKWKPKTPEDQRFFGEPGEIKIVWKRGKKGGYEVQTLIGNDGKAIVDRHITDHDTPKKHSKVHDHFISWDNPDEHPDPQKPTNYYDGNVPELTSFLNMRRKQKMDKSYIEVCTDDYIFESINDFKQCMEWGGEVQFEWKGKRYCAFGKLCEKEDGPVRMLVCEGYYEKDGKCYNVESNEEIIPEETELWCDTADEILEYIVGGDRLRDVITQVEVIDRTL